MTIEKLNADEVAGFKSLLAVFKEVFDTDVEIPDDAHLAELLANRMFLVFVVRVNDQVVGGLTIHVLPSYFNRQPVAYIYDVGIAHAFQRKGLGRTLLEEALRYCHAQGFTGAYVEAEQDDAGAVGFYRRTNYDYEQEAVQFNYTFRRTGV